MFRRYAAFFRPEELDTLTAAFEATWQELTLFGVDLSSEEKMASLKAEAGATHPRISHRGRSPRHRDHQRTGDAKPRRASSFSVSRPMLQKQPEDTCRMLDLRECLLRSLLKGRSRSFANKAGSTGLGGLAYPLACLSPPALGFCARPLL